MAEVNDMFTGLFGTDPSLPPGFMQMPAGNAAPPIPYSPEGWQKSKIMAGTSEGEMKAAPGKKSKDVGFTPEQLAVLGNLMGGQPQQRMPAPGAIAPRNTVSDMRQFSTTERGREQTAPRASLGQIIYGGRKF